MFSKRFNKLIALSTIAAVLISSPIIGQASTISDTYMKGISVGFTSMGSITTLNFTLTGDYIIDGQGIIINGNNNYNICLANSTLNLYKNSVLLFSTNSDITIKPLNTNTFIQFSKSGVARQFSGSMTFKNNGTSFIPINTLKMEDYLKGVVPYEESNSWPVEALKAQAVAARTYAIKNIGKYANQGFNLSDDTNSQVYNGYNATWDNTNKAVDSTKGVVLTYNGSAIDALFSSSNGGYTEVPQSIGWNSLPYIPSTKEDTYDVNNKIVITPDNISKLIKDKYKLNTVQFKKMDIVKVAGKQNVSNLSITYNDGTNDVVLVLDINDATNNPKSFFNLLSNWFTAAPSPQGDGSFIFNVRNGHGIGMSQWGSYSRANAGMDYNSILNFYYSNIAFENANTVGTIINGTPTRLGGQNRYETSVQIAENMYSGKINNVVLATGADFPDALSGSVLAKAVSAPILLVDAKPTSAGSSPALNYIASHLNQGGNVYLLGGEGVISKDFEAKLTSMKYNFVRLGGINRFDTNTKIVNQLNALNAASSTGLVIATANDFPDALSISPAAALNGWPILLSNKDSLTPDEEKYISSMKPDKVYIAGGNGVVTDNVLNKVKTMLGYGDDKVIRLGGSNRYATSKIINSALFNTPNRIGIATGLAFADALSGSVYAALYRAPIALVDPNQVTEAQNYIKFAGSNANSIDATVFGQTGAVSDTVLKSLTGVTN